MPELLFVQLTEEQAPYKRKGKTMKRITLILAAALLLTGCGDYDSAPGAEGESSSEEITEEVTEEETEPETEEHTEPETEEENEPETEEEAEPDDPDVNSSPSTHYQVGSVTLTEVPEDLKELPDGWKIMTECGLSFAVPEDCICDEPTNESALITGGGVDINLARNTGFGYSDEEDRDMFTQAFAGVGKSFDGTNSSFFNCFFTITPEEYADADQETKDLLNTLATFYDAMDRVYHVEGNGVESFILHFSNIDQPSYCAFIVDEDDSISLGVTFSDSSKDALRVAASFGKE